jgi:hypothetical protein
VLLVSSSCGERAAKEREGVVVERELCCKKRERGSLPWRESCPMKKDFSVHGERAAIIKACGYP